MNKMKSRRALWSKVLDTKVDLIKAEGGGRWRSCGRGLPVASDALMKC